MKTGTHTKKARPLILTHMDLWLGAGLQKGVSKIEKWGLPGHPAPSYPISKHKEDEAENCPS